MFRPQICKGLGIQPNCTTERFAQHCKPNVVRESDSKLISHPSRCSFGIAVSGGCEAKRRALHSLVSEL